MVFITGNKDIAVTHGDEIEHVQKHKHEYKHIQRVVRTKGLRLYAYSPEGKLSEVVIETIEILELVVRDGKLEPRDRGFGKSRIDTRDTHFEALNYKNALRRVNNWKHGKVKELCNLRTYSEVRGLVW